MQIKIQLKVELSVKFHMGRKRLSHENKKKNHEDLCMKQVKCYSLANVLSCWRGKHALTFVKQLYRVMPTLEIYKKKKKHTKKPNII